MRAHDFVPMLMASSYSAAWRNRSLLLLLAELADYTVLGG